MRPPQPSNMSGRVPAFGLRCWRSRVRHKWEQASRLLYVSWQSLTVSQSRCFEDQLVDRPLTVAHREMEDFIDAT